MAYIHTPTWLHIAEVVSKSFRCIIVLKLSFCFNQSKLVKIVWALHICDSLKCIWWEKRLEVWWHTMASIYIQAHTSLCECVLYSPLPSTAKCFANSISLAKIGTHSAEYSIELRKKGEFLFAKTVWFEGSGHCCLSMFHALLATHSFYTVQDIVKWYSYTGVIHSFRALGIGGDEENETVLLDSRNLIKKVWSFWV